MVFEKKQPTDLTALSEQLITRMNENVRRIRVIETRMDTMESRMGSIEETVIEKINELKAGFDRLINDLNKVMEKLVKMESEMQRVMKEMSKVAKKSELARLESLIEIYNPIKSKFVTRDELERILEEKRKLRA